MGAHPKLTLVDIKAIVEQADPQACPHCGDPVAFAVRDGNAALECKCGYWCWLVIDDQRCGQQGSTDG